MNLGSDFEAAKREAGIPTADTGAQPNMLSMGRGKGLQGFLSSPIYAARFKLDTLTNELLEPLFDLLGKKDYLLEGGRPSSLDCLAFGYLATMFYPAVPQAWLKEALQLRYPRLVRYITRMREELLGRDDIRAVAVWSISSLKPDNEVAIAETRNSLGLRLPWHPRSARPLHSTLTTASKEIVSNLPFVSKVLPQDAVIQASNTNTSRTVSSSLPSPLLMNTLFTFTATIAAALAGMAVHHRRNPRDGDLIFWALRPSGGGLGEAGDLLRAFAYQLPR
jgi:sorting and assembly machinery component 37